MGSGRDQTTNAIAGGCCAICCGVCFLVLGLPMLIAGIVMVKIYEGDYDDQLPKAEMEDSDRTDVNLDEAKDILYKVGIALIVIAVVCVIIGIVMVVLLCTGCCGRTNQNRAPTHAVVTQQYPAQQPMTQQPAGYYQPAPQQQAPPQGGYYQPLPQQQTAPPAYDYQMKS